MCGGGIAGRLSKRLARFGIHSIADLITADPVTIRDRFNVVLMRTVLELQGTRALQLETERVLKDQLIYSRSFSAPVTAEKGLRQVLSIYAQQGAARLEKHHKTAQLVQAFAGTSHYSSTPGYYPAVTVKLPHPSSSPITLTRAISRLIQEVDFAMQPRLVRAGIILTDLAAAGTQPALDIFDRNPATEGLGQLIQDVNRHTRPGLLGLGYAGLAQPPEWSMRREMLSARGTTVWDELPLVRSGR